jgi:hypothetical protein
MRSPCFARDAAGGARELLQPAGDEAALETRDERHPDDRERAEHDQREREGETRSDAAKGVHARRR